MEKEICISELKRLSHLYDIEITVAKRAGRRWSYVVSAGEEKLLPSQIIDRFKGYALFVEGKDFNNEAVVNAFRKIIEKINAQKGG
ncbi:hypothetical protein [Mesoaciditoga sp.]